MRTNFIIAFVFTLLFITLGTNKEITASQIEVPQMVKDKWSAVRFDVIDKATKDKREYTVKIGDTLIIPSSALKVVVNYFIPDFVSHELTITSLSNEPNNPAVKIIVYEHDKEVFKGWLYAKFPAIHPFEHEKYEIIFVNGIETDSSRPSQNNVVAEVGQDKITIEEFWTTYDRVRVFYRDIYKDKFDEEFEKKLNLKQNVLDSLIGERLLSLAAKDMRIDVNDEELKEAIRREQAFSRNGLFDSDLYLKRLQRANITPAFFESAKKKELILIKLKQRITESVTLTDNDIKQIEPLPEDTQKAKILKEALLNDKKEKALKAYIDYFRNQKNIIVKSYFQLIKREE